MKRIFTVFLTVCSLAAYADAVPFTKYKLLNRGMNEAEILYRIGPPDHETAVTDYHHHIVSKTWYYIPAQNQISTKRWISEITFDAYGQVSNLKRYRP